jgi:hypothetical protein
VSKRRTKGVWRTPLSKYRFLQFETLTDNGTLSIIAKGNSEHEASPIRCRFNWNYFLAYRNKPEEHGDRFDLVDDEDSGATFIVADSQWFREESEGDGLAEINHSGALHYVILTGDYQTEILSNVQPEVTIL